MILPRVPLAEVLAVALVDRLTIDELPTLYPGDQLFVRREIVGPVREWFVAFLIRVATFTRKDKRPTLINHVATVVRELRAFEVSARAEFPDAALSEDMRRSGPVVDYLIAEALGQGGFQYRRLLGAYGDERLYSIALARHRLATPEHRARIVAACDSLLGRPYGYLKVGAHVLDSGLTWLWNLAGGPGDAYAFRWLCRMERYPMCSWASLYEYRKAGLPFSTSLETGSPDDLFDEVQRKARPEGSRIWAWLFASESIRDKVYDGRGAK